MKWDSRLDRLTSPGPKRMLTLDGGGIQDGDSYYSVLPPDELRHLQQ
jgi:hypothetical protein